MYIQITDMCNMSCEHCCFNCDSSKGGSMMSKQTFKRALMVAEQYGMIVTIGGGEPTLHPQFWEFFGLAMGSDSEYVWMATNGSKTDIAKALAYLSNPDGKFSCALSQDYYHDPIDPSVIDTFKRQGCEIRDVSENLIDVGAAHDNELGGCEGCACESMQIRPNGDLHQCGCPDSPMITNINRVDWELELTNHLDKYSEDDVMDVCYKMLNADYE